MMITGNTLYSVTSVFECADKLTRLYSMRVYLARVQAGGGGVTIWGAFHSRATSELDGNMYQYQYIRIMKTKMLPCATRDFQPNFENVSAHRA